MRLHAVLFVIVVFVIASSPLAAQRELTQERSTMFSGSGNCILCHGPGTTANINSRGEDVSPPNGWRSAMMGSAARDPLWQATMKAEVEQFPGIADVIEDKCTNCHIPMGHEEAHRDGEEYYTLDDATGDPLAMEGVSCTLCHQVDPSNLGSIPSFSGGYVITDERVTFGPYDNPLVQPMLNLTGFQAVYSAHIEQSELCGSCHTLFTPYLDDAGLIAGEFPEQTTMLEWRASYYAREGRHCQSCHMPAVDEAIQISSLPGHAPLRQPLFQHHFVGANTYMLATMKAYADELGATAEDVHFDSSIVRTTAQLTERTVELRASALELPASGDVALRLLVINKAGHKFPSGFPSRRAWLHVTAFDGQDNIVFENGGWDEQGRIRGIDESSLTKHADYVSTEEQVQIYESVMGDVNMQVTATLLRGAAYLKDNRIPPRGFGRGAMENDTIGVVGDALLDINFNSDSNGAVYGSGSDLVDYRLPGSAVRVEAEVCYQSVKPMFMDRFNGSEQPEIVRMRGYHEEAVQSGSRNLVEVIAHVEVPVLPVSTDTPASPSSLQASLFPQPWSPASGAPLTLHVRNAGVLRGVRVQVLNTLGEVLSEQMPGEIRDGEFRLVLPVSSLPAGVYFLRVRGSGTERVLRMVVLPG